MVPRAMWWRAPYALLRTPAVLAAVVCTSLLAALAASSAPLGRAGIESEALKSKIHALTPLGAGLTIERDGTSARGGPQELARADRARRAAALRLGRTLPSTGSPVLTTSTFGRVGGTSLLGSFPLFVVPMARDGATAHVQRIAGPRPGAWVSSAIARLPGLHPGGALILIRAGYESGDKRSLSIPVGAVYRQLDADLGNPYWVNFAARIRPPNPDAGVLPTFVLADPATVYRAAHAVGDGALSNVYEFPVDTRAMTPAAAKRVAKAFDGVRHSLRRSTALSRELGCSPDVGEHCHVTSSLTSAVALAKESAASLNPIVFLLPLLVAAGATGLASRAARVWLRRRRAGPRSTATFLATRRLAAARALPLVLTVTAAVSVSALAFAEILGTSLHANRTEKAYVANGAEVQGLIDVGQALPRQFPYPITKVIETFNTGRLDEASRQVEVLAVDSASLQRVLRWQWSGDPQAALRTLGDSRAPLPAIAIGAARGAHQLLIGGGQLPVQVVATLHAFPAMPASGPMLVVPRCRRTPRP